MGVGMSIQIMGIPTPTSFHGLGACAPISHIGQNYRFGHRTYFCRCGIEAQSFRNNKDLAISLPLRNPEQLGEQHCFLVQWPGWAGYIVSSGRKLFDNRTETEMG